MNCLEKYRSKLIRGINSQLRIVADRPEEDAVHDFRVGIKRLTALYYFFNQVDAELNAKQLMKPYRRLFKSIGIIRDAHIVIDLIMGLGGIDSGESRVLLKNLRSAIAGKYRLFQEQLQANSKTMIRMPGLKSLRLSERALLHNKPILLNKLLSEILLPDTRLDATAWHRKRILLKRYHHILDAFCFCPGHGHDVEELKQMKILEQLLGDWHDRVIAIETLASMGEVKSEAATAIAIMKRQDQLLLGSAKIYLQKFERWHRERQRNSPVQ